MPCCSTGQALSQSAAQRVRYSLSRESGLVTRSGHLSSERHTEWNGVAVLAVLISAEMTSFRAEVSCLAAESTRSGYLSSERHTEWNAVAAFAGLISARLTTCSAGMQCAMLLNGSGAL